MNFKRILARKYEIILAVTFVMLLGSLVVLGYLASVRFEAITDSLMAVLWMFALIT